MTDSPGRVPCVENESVGLTESPVSAVDPQFLLVQLGSGIRQYMILLSFKK